MAKKDFTKADGAVDRMFSAAKKEQSHISNISDVTNITKDTNIYNNSNHTKHTNNDKVKNKSKHYDERGPRNERVGLLLDSQLKEELLLLSKASSSKSMNDFIVTILVEYVGKEESRKKVEMYKQMIL